MFMVMITLCSIFFLDILYQASLLQLFEESSKVVSSYCVHLFIFNFGIAVRLQIIIEDFGRCQHNTTRRLIKLACTYNFLSHVCTIPKNLYFSQFLGIPEPDFTYLRNGNQLMLLIVKFNEYDFMLVSFDAAFLNFGFLVQNVNFTANSGKCDDVKCVGVAYGANWSMFVVLVAIFLGMRWPY